MAFLLEDVRYGLRTLAKNPGFTLVAVAALALGIGVNATVFTLSNGVLFKSMPFDKNDRILYLSTRNANRGNQRSGVSYADFRDWKAETKSFEELGAFRTTAVNYSDKTGLPELYSVSQMTANSFQAIGQKPAIGRDFTSADEARGAAPVTILSYGLWERRYGKDPAVIGRSVRLNDVPSTIIGVMAQGFMFPGTTDLWTAYVPGADSEKREARQLVAFGRMKDGVTLKSARAEMDGITRRLENAYPTTNQGIGGMVQTFSEAFNGPQIAIVFSAMLGAVGFVLLIACANVANLLLGRAVGRIREISIRSALGASRWRVIRQMLVESVMLSVMGGGIGWLIAIWGVRTFDAVVTPLGKPAFIDFSMDYRVFGYLVLISVGTGVLFGLAPALRLSRLDLNTALKDGGRGSSGGGRGKYLSGLLVVTEMALAVVLLVGAGLMVRSFLVASNAATGININHVLTMRLQLPDAKYKKNEDLVAFHDRLNAQLSALPGVETVSIASALPTGGSLGFPYEMEGAPPVDEKRRLSLNAIVIGPEYFAAAGLRVLRGRLFTDRDTSAALPVVLVNQRFAAKFWPNQDPIGRRLRLFQAGKPEAWSTVVGVVPDVVQNTRDQDGDPLIYIPFRQKPQRDMAIVARTKVPPAGLGPAFRKAVQSIDEDLPVYRLMSMEERLAQNYWQYQVFGGLFAIFAGIALLLASVGLYAVIQHSVSQRTQEIGVRMALGASAGEILKLVFGQGMAQLAIGLAVGSAAAFGVTRILRTLLAGNISPSDPASFAVASLTLAAAAVLGCWVPARRAMKVDPVIALRQD